MNAWKKIACAALAVAMLLVTGCTGADTSWAYRAGDIQPSIGVYIFYMVNASSEAETEWHKEHDPDDAEHEHPPYKDMLKETMQDGQTIAEYIRVAADKKIREHIAVESQFAARGLALTDEETSYASSTAASSWANDEENYTRLGVAESSLRQVILNQLKREALFQASYGASGENAVPDSEIEKVIQRDYVLVDVMAIHTGEEDNAEAAAKEAEEYKKRLDAGENIYDLIQEYEQKEADASDEGESVVERAAEGSRSVIISEADRATYGDALTDAALGLTTGSSATAQEGSYVYLMQRGDILSNPAYVQTYRDAALRTLKEDEFEELITGWAGELSIETNQAALDRYQPAKLKIEE